MLKQYAAAVLAVLVLGCAKASPIPSPTLPPTASPSPSPNPTEAPPRVTPGALSVDYDGRVGRTFGFYLTLTNREARAVTVTMVVNGWTGTFLGCEPTCGSSVVGNGVAINWTLPKGSMEYRARWQATSPGNYSLYALLDLDNDLLRDPEDTTWDWDVAITL